MSYFKVDGKILFQEFTVTNILKVIFVKCGYILEILINYKTFIRRNILLIEHKIMLISAFSILTLFFYNNNFRDSRTVFVRYNAMHCEHDYLRSKSEYRDGYYRHGEEKTWRTRLVG